MAFAPTFGAVGDFIAVSIIAKDLVIALYETRGSSQQYQQVIRDLKCLDGALVGVDDVCKRHGHLESVKSIRSNIEEDVEQCRNLIEGFKAKVKKYAHSLAPGGSGNMIRDGWRRVQWASEGADRAHFENEIHGMLGRITVGLATMTMGLFNLGNSASDYVSPKRARMPEETPSMMESLNKVLNLVQETVPGLGAKMVELIQVNSHLRQEMTAIRHHIPSVRIERPLLDDYFILEDAIGRVSAVNLIVIPDWESVRAILRQRFHGRPGARRVARGRFELRGHATGMVVDQNIPLDRAVPRGQKVNMTLICRSVVKVRRNEEAVNFCPRCGVPSGDPTFLETTCMACGMVFHRITEIADDGVQLPPDASSPPSPPAHSHSTDEGLLDYESTFYDRGHMGARRRRSTSVWGNMDHRESSDEDDTRPFTRVKVVEKRVTMAGPEAAPYFSEEGSVDGRILEVACLQHHFVQKGRSNFLDSNNRVKLDWMVPPESLVGRSLQGRFRLLDLLSDVGSPDGKLVYWGVDTQADRLVAVKAFCKWDSQQPPSRKDYDIRRQVQCHSKLRHRNIIEVVLTIDQPEWMFILYNLCPEGDLWDAIVHGDRYKDNDNLIRRDFLQILDGVQYCHEQGVYHLDLKPEHILLARTQEGTVMKLGGFASATMEPVTVWEHTPGTLSHRPPEFEFRQPGEAIANAPVDVWCLGVVLVNMTTSKNIFHSWKSFPNLDLLDLLDTLPITYDLFVVLKTIFRAPRQRTGILELKENIGTCRTFHNEPWHGSSEGRLVGDGDDGT